MPNKIAIFGTSGFARETMDIALVVGYEQLVFLDKNKGRERIFGYAVFKEEQISTLIKEGYNFIIGIGDNRTREKIVQNYPHLPYINLIHPTATFGKGQKELIETKKGNIIAAGVRFTNNIAIGDYCIFNLNCTIGHDCIIEDFVNINPGDNISGNVYLSKGAYIGTNESIIQGQTDNKLMIETNAIVGAGSVVVRGVPPNITVIGVPAHEKEGKYEYREADTDSGGGRTRKGPDILSQGLAA